MSRVRVPEGVPSRLGVDTPKREHNPQNRFKRKRSGFESKRRSNEASEHCRLRRDASLSVVCDNDVARWSSGQDGGLSRRKQEFDSPTGHQRHILFLRKQYVSDCVLPMCLPGETSFPWIRASGLIPLPVSDGVWMRRVKFPLTNLAI